MQRYVANAIEDHNVAFVLIPYVVVCHGDYQHCPCITSYSDATMLDIDPLNVQV